jgi:hypothetical protein
MSLSYFVLGAVASAYRFVYAISFNAFNTKPQECHATTA